jgi:hypothetical protein
VAIKLLEQPICVASVSQDHNVCVTLCTPNWLYILLLHFCLPRVTFFIIICTMAPSLIETSYFILTLFVKGIVASGVAQRFDLFYFGLLTHCFRCATVCRTPLDE